MQNKLRGEKIMKKVGNTLQCQNSGPVLRCGWWKGQQKTNFSTQAHLAPVIAKSTSPPSHGPELKGKVRWGGENISRSPQALSKFPKRGKSSGGRAQGEREKNNLQAFWKKDLTGNGT